MDAFPAEDCRFEKAEEVECSTLLLWILICNIAHNRNKVVNFEETEEVE